jgi:hypothetical protein
LILLLLVSGCSVLTRSGPIPHGPLPVISSEEVPHRFTTAVRRMRPMLAKTCKNSNLNLNCDFVIVITCQIV